MEGGAGRSARPVLPALGEAVCDTQWAGCFQLSSGKASGCFPQPYALMLPLNGNQTVLDCLPHVGSSGVHLAVAYQVQVIVTFDFRGSLGYWRPVLRDRHFQVLLDFHSSH